MKWNYLVLKVLGRTTGGFVNGGLKKFGIFGYFGTDGFGFNVVLRLWWTDQQYSSEFKA